MGDMQHYELLRSLADRMRGPVLEIGSKRYGAPPVSFDYRVLFPAAMEYVGVDASEGEGVDRVVDMTMAADRIQAEFGGKRFGTIICLSVLEHVKDIFTFSRNVECLLDDGGLLVISVPFAWEMHAYPGDYWRFTPEAVQVLFPSVDFDLRMSRLHTDWGRTVSLADAGPDLNLWTMYFSAAERSRRTFPGRVRRMAFSLVRRLLGLKNNMLYSTMFDMVGVKKR